MIQELAQWTIRTQCVCVYRGIVHSGGVQFGIPPRLVWRQLRIYTVHICSVSVKVVFVCVASTALL